MIYIIIKEIPGLFFYSFDYGSKSTKKVRFVAYKDGKMIKDSDEETVEENQENDGLSYLYKFIALYVSMNIHSLIRCLPVI